PIDLGTKPSSIAETDVEVPGFGGNGLAEIGSNRVVGSLGGLIYAEGLRTNRCDAYGHRGADGTEVGPDPGDSGGGILSAGGDAVIGVTTRLYPEMTRDTLTASFGAAVGAKIADDLELAAKGPNPKILFSGVLLSNPESSAFLESAPAQGYNVKFVPAAAPVPSPKAPSRSKSKTLSELIQSGPDDALKGL
ncbi:MAG TPA: hypothetical protein VH309_04370, partial [Elusimicrobiota bacterium]|nr:hypothetical protein [Elusimicrobiota bacterium]